MLQTVVAHEAPMVLPAPRRKLVTISPPQIPWRRMGKLAAATVGTLTVAASVVAMIMTYLIGAAVVADPCLLVVLDDHDGVTGTWMEIARWDQLH